MPTGILIKSSTDSPESKKAFVNNSLYEDLPIFMTSPQDTKRSPWKTMRVRNQEDTIFELNEDFPPINGLSSPHSVRKGQKEEVKDLSQGKLLKLKLQHH